MTWTILLKFLGDIAWPVAVSSLILLFRTQISDAINRAREFEGPGDLKLTFDPRQVERIVAEGRAENASASEVAQRIVEQAVVDERELRILRGLLGEQAGRSMNAYQSAFYRPAIDSLMSKEMIRFSQGKYFLTDKGLAAVRDHIIPLINEK
jgi:hypothetical protein